MGGRASARNARQRARIMVSISVSACPEHRAPIHTICALLEDDGDPDRYGRVHLSSRDTTRQSVVRAHRARACTCPTHGTDVRDDTPPIQAEARWAPTQTTAPASTRQHRHLCSTRKHLCSNLTRCRGRSGKRGKFWRGHRARITHLRRAVGGDAHPRRGLRRLGWRLVLGAPLAARARSSHGVV